MITLRDTDRRTHNRSQWTSTLSLALLRAGKVFEACGRLGFRKKKSVLCLLLVASMLLTSTPAAARIVVDLASGLPDTTVLWLRTSGWSAVFLRNPFRQRPDQQETQRERSERAVRIKISPEDIEIPTGMRLHLSAVAYDRNDVTVGGIRFKWSDGNRSPSAQSVISQEGEFRAEVAGDYLVRVEAEHLTAVARIRVVGNDVPKATATVRTSTKRISSSDPSSSANSSQKDPLSLLQCEDIGEFGGWNECNRDVFREPRNDRGAPAGHLPENGNFQIVTPVVTLPGRSINVNLNLVYNSRLWSKSELGMTYDIDHDWPAPGWSLGFGKLINMLDKGAMLVEADGTRHSYKGDLTSTTFTNGTLTWTNKRFEGYTTDGSFIKYVIATWGDTRDTYATVEYPNGLRIEYYNTLGGGTSTAGTYILYPFRMQDVNGNLVNISNIYDSINGHLTWTGRINNVTDTLGRIITFHYDNRNLLTAVTAAGVKDDNGNVTTRELVRLHYQQRTLGHNFGTLSTQVRNPSPYFIDAIYYPGVTNGYWFGDTDSYSSYGMIRKVIEQRGMGFSASGLNDAGNVTQGTMSNHLLYDYPVSVGSALSEAPVFNTITESWEGITTAAAVTTYDVNLQANPRTTTITLPDNTRQVQYAFNHESLPASDPDKYKDGLVFKNELQDAAANVLQRTTINWEKGDIDSPRPTRTEDTVITPDGRNLTTATEYSYGSYNGVTQLREFDYNGALMRRIDRTYIHTFTGPGQFGYFVNLMTSEGVFAANGDRVSYKVINYDNYTETPLVPRTAVQFFSLGWSVRGNPTSITRYKDATSPNPSGPLTQKLAYDDTGNLVSTTDPGGKQTRFIYTSATQFAYPTSQILGSSGAEITTSTSYDFNTGLQLSVIDANSRTTQAKYATQTWRPTKTISATGATTHFNYNDVALSFTESSYTDDGITLAAQNIKRMTGRGQVRREEALAGTNLWDVVEKRYDKLGRLVKQTRPFRSTTNENDWKWTELFYDSQGRMFKSIGADGSVLENVYNELARPQGASTQVGQTIKLIDAWQREKWGRFDPDGRLVEVVEPNPNGNGSVSTGGLVSNYTFNVLGNLLQVVQGDQSRTFKYDSLGRLTHQKLAEKSATLDNAGTYVGSGGLWSDAFVYDDRSNLVLQTDARGVKASYSFSVNGQLDPLNRLRSVSYDAQGIANVLSAPTITYNYVSSGDITRVLSVVTQGVSTEEYLYDTEGRVQEKKVTFNNRVNHPLILTFLYDTLNRATDLYYPQQYPSGGTSRKHVHYDYDLASRLNKLTVDQADYANQIAYNASSQATSLKIGGAGSNQITESYAYSDATGLLENQKVVRGAGGSSMTLLDLTYEYLRPGTTSGRTGQVTRISNNLNHNRDRNYTYDALGRLVQAKGGPASDPLWTLTYGYDRYGNRTSVSANGFSAKFGNRVTDQLAAKEEVDLPDSLRTDLPHSLSDSSFNLGAFVPTKPAARPDPPVFTDNPLVASTLIKAIHLTELRNAVNQARALAGQSAASWGEAIAAGVIIKASHIVELRARLDEARSALGLPAASYTDPTLTAGIPVKAVHIQELRDRVTEALSGSGSPIPLDGLASLSHDPATNRITTPGFTYDAAGNQTRIVRADGSALRFQYDAAGRLAKIQNDSSQTLQSYTYSAGRQRVITQDGNDSSNLRTYYVWGADSVLSEFSENDTQPVSPFWSKNYIYLGSKLLATQEPGAGSGLVQFHHPDRLGTVLVTNPATGTSFEQATLPFGTALAAESTGSTNRRFTSYDRNPTTRLDYAVNRTYDSTQGRFTQADPIGMQTSDPLDPQSFNLYSYCHNDPINWTDLDGTQGTSISFSPFPGSFGGGSGALGGLFGSFISGLFSFGLGLLGFFLQRPPTHILGSPFINQPFLWPPQRRTTPPPPPPPPTVIAVAGTYSQRYESTRPGGTEMFKKRGLYSVRNNQQHFGQFASGAHLLTTLVDLSTRVGTINRINLLFHGYSPGAISHDSRPEPGSPSSGFYIDYPSHSLYRTYQYPLTAENRNLGARGASELVDLIVAGRINIANGGHIVLFGCHTDALASHIQWLLKDRGRPDIRVTGATGFVDFRKFRDPRGIPSAWTWDGWWNTYTGADNHMEGGTSRFMPFR